MRKAKKCTNGVRHLSTSERRKIPAEIRGQLRVLQAKRAKEAVSP